MELLDVLQQIPIYVTLCHQWRPRILCRQRMWKASRSLMSRRYMFNIVSYSPQLPSAVFASVLFNRNLSTPTKVAAYNADCGILRYGCLHTHFLAVAEECATSFHSSLPLHQFLCCYPLNQQLWQKELQLARSRSVHMFLPLGVFALCLMETLTDHQAHYSCGSQIGQVQHRHCSLVRDQIGWWGLTHRSRRGLYVLLERSPFRLPTYSWSWLCYLYQAVKSINRKSSCNQLATHDTLSASCQKSVYDHYLCSCPDTYVCRDRKGSFYQALHCVLRSTPRSDKLFLMGDFNASVGADHRGWGDFIGNTVTASPTVMASAC